MTRSRFQPGNPGKPKGARHKTTLAMEALLEGEAEALTRKCVDKAMEGDMTAMRLCLDRLAPARRDRPVPFSLPPVETVQDAKGVLALLLGSVAAGELTPAEANDVARLVDSYVEAVKVTDLAERMDKLEELRGSS